MNTKEIFPSNEGNQLLDIEKTIEEKGDSLGNKLGLEVSCQVAELMKAFADSIAIMDKRGQKETADELLEYLHYCTATRARLRLGSEKIIHIPF